MFPTFKRAPIHHRSSSGDVINPNPKPLTFLNIVTLYPRSTLFVLLFIIQVLLLSFYIDFPFTRLQISNPNPNSIQNNSNQTNTKLIQENSNPKNPNSNTNPIQKNSNPTNRNQCKYGKFYVYNLPAVFNTEILTRCETLGPYGSLCNELSNNGLGQKAVGIERVIPTTLAHTWYWTDQFNLEVMFHHRMLHHKCRTHDPESASAFYIPIYVGLAVRKALKGKNNFEERDMLCNMMLNWIQTQQPYFNRLKGLDHFLTIGRITWEFRRDNTTDWGSSFLKMQAMNKITRLLIERFPTDDFDLGIPYPTGFHPTTDSDVVLWQEFARSRERHALFSFVGGKRPSSNDIRTLLFNQCSESGESCRGVDCGQGKCYNGRSDILETFLDSEFCLQPRGDSYTRKSIFDCMVAGSIPVFLWNESAYIQYPWFLKGEPESYSVFIHHDGVYRGTTSIKSVLEKYSKEEIRKLRDKVVEFIPKIIYAKPNEGLKMTKDAVDVAVDGALKRIKKLVHQIRNDESKLDG